ncbi:MAG: chloride channel protein [Thermoleophilia bacterium]|nr:chloride channel protein [Thermoleophilia bacterium]
MNWFHDSSFGLAVLAVVIGAGGGLGAILFRYLIEFFTWVFTGYRDYTELGRVPNPHLPGIGSWYVILVPVVGGLLYGPLVARFAREARGHGVPEVMLAVVEKGGRIRPRVAVVKSLASALCIGSGGSVGREGPIAQIGSALGSTLGQLVHAPPPRLRLLVACGAAAGVSATFNAPIAGVFFALEIILSSVTAQAAGAVVLSSVTAVVIGRAAFGEAAFLPLPAFGVSSLGEYGLYVLLGVLAGGLGVAFIRTLYGMEDIADRLWRGPEWLRPAAGGIVLGLLLFAVPQMYGVGYPVIERSIAGEYVVAVLLGLALCKVVATSLTLSIGGSGGVFAPSLFMGAMLGSAFGQSAQTALPGTVTAPGAYGIVGMAAVFAATARAPLTSITIIFELTGDYRIILPLMLAVGVATGISSLLSRDTIYTLKLRRRGIDIMRGRAADLLEAIPVRDAAQPLPEPVALATPALDLIARFARTDADTLPVVDGNGRYRGVVTVEDVDAAVREGDLDADAGQLVHGAPAARPDASLQSALRTLAREGLGGMPIVSEDETLQGWVTHRALLRAYADRLGRDARSARRGARVPQGPAYTGRRSSPVPALRGYRLVDLRFDHDRPPVGSRLVDIPWPRGTLVVAVRRDAGSFEPAGDTVLMRNDRLTVLVPRDLADSLADVLEREAAADSPRPPAGEHDA